MYKIFDSIISSLCDDQFKSFIYGVFKLFLNLLKFLLAISTRVAVFKNTQVTSSLSMFQFVHFQRVFSIDLHISIDFVTCDHFSCNEYSKKTFLTKFTILRTQNC